MTKKKKWGIIIFGIIVIASSGIFWGWKNKNKVEYDTVIVKRQDLIQEVSVTGRVQATESVDLAFEQNGRVLQVLAFEGDAINNGDAIVILDSVELATQLRQAQATLQSSRHQRQSYQAQLSVVNAQVSQAESAVQLQQALLDELNKGARKEELDVSRTKVVSAQNALDDANLNLEKVKKKVEADLNNTYTLALNETVKAVTLSVQALMTLTDIQFAHFLSESTDSNALAIEKANASLALFGKSNLGRASRKTLEDLHGGAQELLIKAQTFSSEENISFALQSALAGLEKTKTALNSVQTASITPVEITSLETEKNSIDSELLLLVAKEQNIKVQKLSNDSLINTAQSAVNSSRDSLKLANDQLLLLEAGSSSEAIRAQEAKLRQAQADLDKQGALVEQANANLLRQNSLIAESQASLENIRAKLAKRVLIAPFSGIITKQDSSVGEIITANVPVVSMISEGNFEVKVFVPEVDISKIEIGDFADITLDAYGNNNIFRATVTHIDPAENVIDGVPTYKMIMQFDELDKRIKSGMTANIDIVTDKRENVIVVPRRTIISKNGRLFVRVLEKENNKDRVIEKDVKTGLKGSDGNIEILRGVVVDDEVILFEKKN